MAGLSAEEDRVAEIDHLVVACEPHKVLPVMVWLGPVLLAQLPSREVLADLLRQQVLQQLTRRVLPILRATRAAR